MGIYSFYGQQVIRGLPVLTNAGYTFYSANVTVDGMYPYEGGYEAEYYVFHVEAEDGFCGASAC